MSTTPSQGQTLDDLTALAPSVRFPVTIAVVCYGRNVALADRFLRSLYEHTSPELFRLRAGLNEVEAATARLFADYSARYGNIDCYVEPRNIFKNPLMRRLFHQKPVKSEWIVWCDDDTHFTRGDWLHRLALKIEQAPLIDMWGVTFRLWPEDPAILEWIRGAAWYRSEPWLMARRDDDREAPVFKFISGGFWAMRTRVMQKLDWPDPRLIQANEDFLLGEALRQNGYRQATFTHGVVVSDAPRRNANAPEVNRLTGVSLTS